MAVTLGKWRKPFRLKFIQIVSLCVVCSLSIRFQRFNVATKQKHSLHRFPSAIVRNHERGDLFIGYAEGYPPEVIFRVSSSFHSVTGAPALLVLFSDIDSATRSHLEAKFTRLRVVNIEYPGTFVEDRISHVSQEFTNPAFQRYLAIHAWLTVHSKEFRHVIMSDIRDVAFFGDPFRQLKSDTTPGVQVFTELLRYKDDAKWNQKWLRNCYGQSFVDEILQEYITCCGVIAGTSESLLEYLDLFVEELNHKKGCDKTGLDTAIHVWIIHRRLNNTKIIDSEMSLIRHAPNLTGTRLNSRGEPVNLLGEPYALVHQADRLPSLWQRYCSQHDPVTKV